MKIIIGLTLLILEASASPVVEDVQDIQPDQLESLLKHGRYEEFAYLMGIDNVELLKPGNKKDPMFNAEIPLGDVIDIPAKIEKEAMGRQMIRFERHPGSQWKHHVIPYILFGFNQNEEDVIERAIRRWNQQHNCLRIVPRTNEASYVIVFPGNGCWSMLGRVGGPQLISLQRNGCLWQPIVLHEFTHAAGVHHEHSRHDRDKYVRVIWENIPERWRPQYVKTDEINFDIKSRYDYYSIMHYPMNAPETNKPAFEILSNETVNTDRIGRAYDFTEEDKEKLRLMYCHN